MIAAVGLAWRSPCSAAHVKRVMEAFERAVVLPAAEIVIDRTARRQVFRHRARRWQRKRFGPCTWRRATWL
jgi:hypothetical protein